MYFNGSTALEGLDLLTVIEVSRAHTHTHTHLLNSTPLDEGSDRRKDLYLTSHNTHTRQTSMSPAGFEPAIPESEQPETHVLDRAAIRIGLSNICYQLTARRTVLLENKMIPSIKPWYIHTTQQIKNEYLAAIVMFSAPSW